MARPERSIRAEAVVLRHSDWGEADRILSLYTRQMGKVRAIAKGVRKMRSRKSGHLEPFTQVNLQLARGRDMFIVTQAEAINAYLHLRDDLVRVGYASYVVELLDRFTFDDDENPSLFHLLAETLKRLDQESSLYLAVRYYEIRLLDLLGYRPHLFHCANCENEIKAEAQYFSALQGGVLCPKCGPGAPEARPISMQALKYLRHFQRSSYAQASRARISPDVNWEMEQIMQYYLTYLLERGLNTPAFLRHINS
ncbi:MAG TPA: DNA repair protein RecO [Anaerolineales bacterium]